MSCACDLVVPDVFDRRHRRAAKERGCCECGRAIEPGERYEEVTGLWDGCWSRYRTCQGCERLRATVDCVAFGGLFEFLWQEHSYTRGWLKRDTGEGT